MRTGKKVKELMLSLPPFSFWLEKCQLHAAKHFSAQRTEYVIAVETFNALCFCSVIRLVQVFARNAGIKSCTAVSEN